MDTLVLLHLSLATLTREAGAEDLLRNQREPARLRFIPEELAAPDQLPCGKDADHPVAPSPQVIVAWSWNSLLLQGTRRCLSSRGYRVALHLFE
jgi:hypothetical protein